MTPKVGHQQLGFMYKKHSFEEKLRCMRLLDERYPLRRLSKESGILCNQLRDLRKRYLAFGENWLRRKPAHYASEAEKASVRAEIMEKALPLNEICLKYDVSESAIRNWHKIEGKPPQPMAKRKKEASLSELEELRARVEYLEAENALLKKSESLSRSKGCPSERDWAEAIHELRREHDLELLLRIRGMARSTFYYHISLLSGPDKYEDIKQRVCIIYKQHKGRYGYRRITLQLRNEGVTINHKTIQRLMADMGLKAKVKRAKYRSFKGEIGRIAPNVIDRDFKTTGVNQKWATDITEYKINEEKGYLSPILDMNNGEIVAYAKSRHPNLELVLRMVDDAIAREKPPRGLFSIRTRDGITRIRCIRTG